LKEGKLAVLGPKKYLKTYKWDEATSGLTPDPSDSDLGEEAIAFYQGANFLYKNRLDRLK
ncbi:MAG: hypothetical protein M0025_13080, partial [Elusimicrobia bacterium]|nr:hypothetical protein [Elusimicrobiota bacterium]